MRDQISFYQSFYGFEFYRYFIRPPDFKSNKFRIQFPVKTPKQLNSNVHRNSGFHPCYVSIYDSASNHDLNGKNSNTITFDRAFYDFDIDNQHAHEIKKKLQDLRSHSLNYNKNLQDELRIKLQNLIIDDRIAEQAIIEAKNFSRKFKDWFGSYPILFFSGCKGAHAYTFFEPVQIDIKDSLYWFAQKTKETYKTLDLSVYGSLNSRIPYTKHQYTGLTVVPFSIEDNYDEIMAKSLCPGIEPFARESHLSRFGKHLQKIDPILQHNDDLRKKERMVTLAAIDKPYNPLVKDQRLFFKSILGEPDKEYPDKEYVMYRCPFPWHDDNKPSFRVHKTGYFCYGCGRKGNYFQFLKDYNGWSNNQVKAHLKSNLNRNKGVK